MAEESQHFDLSALQACLRRLNQLEEQTLDTTTRAFVRVVSEDLKNDQVVLLIVRGRITVPEPWEVRDLGGSDAQSRKSWLPGAWKCPSRSPGCVKASKKPMLPGRLQIDFEGKCCQL